MRARDGSGNPTNAYLHIDIGYDNVQRSGNSVSFNYGIRFRSGDTSPTLTGNTIKAWADLSQEGRFAFRGSSGNISSGVWYYAYHTQVTSFSGGTGQTSESLPWSWSGTVGTYDTSVANTIRANWNAYDPEYFQAIVSTLYVPIPALGSPSGGVSHSSIGVNSATITGSVSSWGSYATAGSQKIEYGTSTGYGTTVNSGSHNLTGLSQNTTYYYRYTITNGQGLSSSYTGSFKTLAGTPGAPTSCTASSSSDSVNYTRGAVNISWGGATGTITGYEVQRANTGPNDGTFGSWTTLSTPSTDTGMANAMAGVQFKYRICAKNGSLASGWKESNTMIVRGGVRRKNGNEWKMGTVWIHKEGGWKLAKAVWRKNVNGEWKMSV